MFFNCKRLSLLVIIFLTINSLRALSLAPILISPIDGDCLNPGDSLVWQQESDVLSYVINVSSSADMSNIVQTSSGLFVRYIPADFSPALLDGMTYYWQVRVYYNTPDAQDSSMILSFKTPQSAPTLSLPADAATCQSRTLSLKWIDNPGLDFDLQVSASNTFATTVVNLPGIATKEEVITVPNFNTTYYWRVRSKGDVCYSKWSATRSFTTAVTPPAPSLPADSSIGMSESVTFRWNNSSGTPSSYRFQASTDSIFMNVIIDEFTTDQFYNGTMSYNNTNIFWHVKASYTSCETDWSKTYRFRTEMVKAITISPKRDSSCAPQTLKFEWINVADANAYRLQISESEDFTNPIVNRSKIKNTWDTVTFAKSLQMYFWRVRAEDNSNTGIWSDVLRFSTAPASPKVLYPANKDTVPITVNFVWNKVEEGAIYRVQISEYSDFTINLLDKKIQDTTFPFKLPNFYKKYYWRLNVEVSMCKSNWSAPTEFKTVIMPCKLISPANLSVKQSVKPRFNWSVSEGSNRYQFRISKEITFNTIVSGKVGIPTNSFTYDKELEQNTQYFWQIKAGNAQGNADWSEIFTFTTGGIGPDNPDLVSPANNAEGLQVLVKFIWKSAPRATKYELMIDDNEDFENPIHTFENITDTSYEVGNLENSKVYYWKINASNDIGVSSSEIWLFKTIVMPPSDTAKQLMPENDSKDVSVQLTFSWTSVPRAEVYEIQLATNSQFDEGTIITQDTNISALTKYMSDLPYNTTIYWRVRGKNEAGKGPWSEPWKFKSIISSVEDHNLSAKFNVSILPNPNNGDFTISFELFDDSKCSFELYDLTGRLVGELKSSDLSSGSQKVRFNNADLPDGVYLLRLKLGMEEFYQELYISK